MRTTVMTCAGREVRFHKVGLRWHGICPFCAEGAFATTGDEQSLAYGIYFCHACGAKGHVNEEAD